MRAPAPFTAGPAATDRTRFVLWALLPLWLAISAMQTRLLLGNQPLGCDLLPLWTAGRIAFQRPHDLYRFDVITNLQRWAIGDPVGLRPWIYPPSALLLFAPFGKLSFGLFYPLWTGATAALFGWITAIHLRRDRWVSLALLGFGSACCTSILIGQANLLVGALLLAGIGSLGRRPMLAGLLLAAAALIKPTSLILMPVALLAIGNWRAVAAGVLTAIVAVSLSALLFGWQTWLDWLHALPAFDRLVRSEPTLWRGVLNFTWLAHLAGGDGLVLAIRAALAVAGAALVWAVFRRTEDLAVRVIVMAGSGLLITPYAMSYDAVIVAAPAVILMSCDPRRIGWGFTCFLLAALAASPPAAPFGLLALVVVAAAPSLRNLAGPAWQGAITGRQGEQASVQSGVGAAVSPVRQQGERLTPW